MLCIICKPGNMLYATKGLVSLGYRFLLILPIILQLTGVVETFIF